MPTGIRKKCDCVKQQVFKKPGQTDEMLGAGSSQTCSMKNIVIAKHEMSVGHGPVVSRQLSEVNRSFKKKSKRPQSIIPNLEILS